MKDFQRELEEMNQAREDAIQSAKDNEKKAKLLETDLTQMQEDLAASERARKTVEAERDELQDEITNSATSKWVQLFVATILVGSRDVSDCHVMLMGWCGVGGGHIDIIYQSEFVVYLLWSIVLFI